MTDGVGGRGGVRPAGGGGGGHAEPQQLGAGEQDTPAFLNTGCLRQKVLLITFFGLIFI